MLTVDDIAELVNDRLAATSDYTTAVPGGAYYARGPEDVSAYPYSVTQIEAGDAEVFSGDLYVQRFTARVAAYAPSGATGSNPLNVAKGLFAGLATTAAQTALQAVVMRNATEKVLHAKPLTPEGEFAPQLREGRDVFVCGLAVELLCQGDRSVA